MNDNSSMKVAVAYHDFRGKNPTRSKFYKDYNL